MQVPYHDERALAVFEKYMAAHVWHGYLNIGDFLDFDFISSFNKGKPGKTEGKRFRDDYAIANAILDRHQQLIWENNPYAKFVMLEGNHEERILRYIAEHPELEGMVDVQSGLRLAQRGFEWVPAWSKGEVYRLGKANFVHGKYTNQYHPAKMATKYGGSVFYGHTHDIMSHSVASLLSHKGMHVGQSLGCLCLIAQEYMKGAPCNWEHGFGVFYIREDGNYSYYVPRIVDYCFTAPDGVTYSA